MNETIYIEHFGMSIYLNTSYDISNFNTIISSLYTGIMIDYLDVGNLIISYDESETLFVGEEFFIEWDELPNLISLFNQSEALRLKFMLPKLSTA